MFDVETTVYSVSDQDASTDADASGYAGSNEYAVVALEEESELVDELDALEVAYQEAVSESATLDTPMVQEEESMVVLYTTAAMGDMPGTMVLDAHVDDYNKRAVRAIGCSAAKTEEQARAYRDQDRRVWDEAQWDVYQTKFGKADAEVAVPDEEAEGRQSVAEVRLEEHTARYLTPRCEPAELQAIQARTVEEQQDAARHVPGLEIPQEILEAEALAQAAKDAQAQLKAMQEQMRLLQEQAKVLHAQAAQAKAAAPVLITPELRAKLDTLAGIVAGGEQAIAKAIVAGAVFVRMPGQAKADTGRIRKVAESPSSNGVVDIHHIGDGATVVSAGNQLSEAKRQAIVAIKNLIHGVALEMISDSLTAKAAGVEALLGCTPKQAATLVHHIKHGSYADVS